MFFFQLVRRSMPLTVLGAFAWLAMLPGEASATPKFVSIQVYDVCDDSGLNCASLGPAGNEYFAVETNKIWAQAEITVNFNFIQNISSTLFSNIDDSFGSNHRFDDLAAAYGTGGPSNTTIDLFLVHTVAGAYGEGWLDDGGIVIAMDTVMSYNGGLGRIDTIAHELGHNLGLLPTGFANEDGGNHSSNPNHLIASGGIRNVPTTLADIAPNGNGYDQIPTDQVALARSSSLLQDAVPEPISMGLVAGGLLAIGLLRRRVA